jgi:hypothetical protein
MGREKGWGPEGSLLVAVIVIAVNLVAGISIQILKRNLEAGRLAAKSCMMLGLFAVALPSVFTLWSSKSTRPIS